MALDNSTHVLPQAIAAKRLKSAIAVGCASSIRAAICGALGSALWLLAPALHADPVDVINGLRAGGCGDRPASGATLAREQGLDNVAREFSRTGSLDAAFARTGYPVLSSSSFHVRGAREDTAMRTLLEARFCDSIAEPGYNEIGVFTRGDETWIVLAVRQISRPALQADAVAERVLELVNAARAQARQCGRDRYEAAAPLSLSATLSAAASGHAWDMAARGAAGHRGSDGSQSGERITRAGYAWRASGENVAAGQPDADSVVAAWLESPGHCVNLMSPYYTEMGIAFATAPSKNPAIYWAQAFAAPL
jgi:uncharacterized protein YkwD